MRCNSKKTVLAKVRGELLLRLGVARYLPLREAARLSANAGEHADGQNLSQTILSASENQTFRNVRTHRPARPFAQVLRIDESIHQDWQSPTQLLVEIKVVVLPTTPPRVSARIKHVPSMNQLRRPSPLPSSKLRSEGELTCGLYVCSR